MPCHVVNCQLLPGKLVSTADADTPHLSSVSIFWRTNCVELKLVDLEEGEPMDMVVGISRMRNFFPTTPQHVIVEAASNSGCEEFAVRCLLLKGYPLKQTGFDEEMTDETRSDATSLVKSAVEETIVETFTGEQTSVNMFTNELTPVEEPYIPHRYY